ncbi:MAG: magnesium transporter [Bdellovibrionales bacterium]|nr:magnesium transporter [Bdellovibrionales bacterium]
MVNERTRLLTATIQKLLHRGAMSNIQRILDKTHSADIASVLQNFSDLEAYEIFKLEPDAATRAEILSYLDNEFQKKMLERSSTEETTQLVNLMDSDDAADLLANLPEAETQSILDSLEVEDSSEVVDLMTYPEDSAGGIMSSDYTEFTEETTVEQVIQALQSDELENKITFYIYVLNSTGHLVGVVSLKQLLLSKKSATLKQLMHPSVISVKVDTDQEEVAQTVERYDFLSIPVVDENNKLVGVITVDDVIDVIREEAEEDLLAMGQAGWGVDMTLFEHFLARLPWQLVAFIAGCICFCIILWFGQSYVPNFKVDSIWGILAFIPLMMALGAMVGNQSATVMVGALQTDRFMGGKIQSHLLREFILGSIFSVLFAGCVLVFSNLMLEPNVLRTDMALTVFLHVLTVVLLGTCFPLLLSRLKLDPTVASVPIVTALADISGIAILFGLIYAG